MFELTIASTELPGSIASNFQRPSEKKQQASIHTTRPKVKLEDAVPSDNEFTNTAQTGIPNSNIIQDSHSAINVFFCDTSDDATTGTFYTNMTHAFPVTLPKSMQDYLLAYHYDTNTIFAKPCPDFKDDTIVTFEEVFDKHKVKGYAP